MTCEEYLSNMKPGYTVDGGSEEHLVMHELSQRALKITIELNNKYHTKEEIVQLMSELTGQKIDESFGMFPPFYTDCGRKYPYRQKCVAWSECNGSPGGYD